MTGSINPINVNTQGVGAKVGYGAQPKQEKAGEEQPAASTGAENKPVNPDKVLEFMSASSASFVPAAKPLDPSKYVNSESEARIAALMGSFEDQVAQGLIDFQTEFAGTGLSDSAMMAAVLNKVNKEA